MLLRSRGLCTIFQKHSYTHSHNLVQYLDVQNLCLIFYTGQNHSHVNQIYSTHSLHFIVANIRFPTPIQELEFLDYPVKFSSTVCKPLQGRVKRFQERLPKELPVSVLSRLTGGQWKSSCQYRNWPVQKMPIIDWKVARDSFYMKTDKNN